MFIVGIILLLAGTVMVYGSKQIITLIGKGFSNQLILKTMGLILAVIGIGIILFGEFPENLNFLRIF